MRWGAGVVLAVAVLSACERRTQTEPIPVVPLAEALPGSVGIPAETLDRLTEQIRNGEFRQIESWLVLRHDKLVHEVYFKGERETRRKVYSVTKSIASLLVGIAIDRGLISGVERPLWELLPEKLRDKTAEDHKAITLAHVLTMAPGLDWHETDIPYSDVRNDHHAMALTDEWMDFVWTKPMAEAPGQRWVYNTSIVHLLSAVLKAQTGMPADEFADRYLFGPLGIQSPPWHKDPQGFASVGGTYGGVQLTARELARIGTLVLRRGLWEGRRIVSDAWIEESTARQIGIDQINRYGYLWWRQLYNVNGHGVLGICAFGLGGQSVYIVPELDMVVVMTASGEEPRADTVAVLVQTLRAARPANP